MQCDSLWVHFIGSSACRWQGSVVACAWCGCRAAQVGAVVRLINVISVLVVVGQTPSYEVLAGIWNTWFAWELYLSRVQNGLITDNSHLWLIVAEGLHPEEQLIKYDSYAPNVNLWYTVKAQAVSLTAGFVVSDRCYLPFAWFGGSLTGRSTQVLGTSRCPLPSSSAQSCLGFLRWFCTSRSQWSSPHHCGK